MRVLLDECLPRKLKRDLPGHFVLTVPQAGWAGILNGALLDLAASKYDVFVTADQNLEYQQNLAARNIAIVVLVARDTRLETLRPLMPLLLTTLETVQSGELVRIG